MKLEKKQIILEAISLLNEQGLENVTLRKLARRLSVQAPSLAWHVVNKNNLLSLMCQSIFQSCFEQMPNCRSGKEWLLEFGKAVWEVQNNTRDVTRLIILTDLTKAARAELDEMIHAMLKKVDLDNPIGYEMQTSVQALATGWSVFRKSPNEQYIEESFLIEDGFANSLVALVDGWGVK